MSNLEKNMTDNFAFQQSTEVLFFYKEIASIIECNRNERESASFILHALNAIQYQTMECGFNPKDYELWSRSLYSVITCCELITRNTAASELLLLSRLRQILA